MKHLQTAAGSLSVFHTTLFNMTCGLPGTRLYLSRARDGWLPTYDRVNRKSDFAENRTQ